MSSCINYIGICSVLQEDRYEVLGIFRIQYDRMVKGSIAVTVLIIQVRFGRFGCFAQQ